MLCSFVTNSLRRAISMENGFTKENEKKIHIFLWKKKKIYLLMHLFIFKEKNEKENNLSS